MGIVPIFIILILIILTVRALFQIRNSTKLTSERLDLILKLLIEYKDKH